MFPHAVWHLVCAVATFKPIFGGNVLLVPVQRIPHPHWYQYFACITYPEHYF